MLVINDKLIPIEYYVENITEVSSSAATVSKVKGSTTPRVLLNVVRDTYFILN